MYKGKIQTYQMSRLSIFKCGFLPLDPNDASGYRQIDVSAPNSGTTRRSSTLGNAASLSFIFPRFAACSLVNALHSVRPVKITVRSNDKSQRLLVTLCF